MNYVMFTRSNKSILTVVYTLGMFEKGKEKILTAAFLQLGYEKKIRHFNGVKVIFEVVFKFFQTL